jgi:MoaA/NifB/PqqE/SkfB family radical SAM enzyme
MKFLEISDIKTANVEISTKCNAACPLCPRNYNGYGVRDNFPLRDMTTDEFKSIIEQIPGLKVVSLCGNYGDPAISKHVIKILDYLDQRQIDISMSSNGSLRTTKWWANLARYKTLRIEFGLDGLSDTHSTYRQNTNWHKVIDNATAFINAGGHAIWQFIEFEHNKHQLQECRELSVRLGFKEFKTFNDNRSNGIAFTPQGKPFTLGNTSVPTITADEFVAQEKHLQKQYELNKQVEYVRELKVDSIDCFSQQGNIYVAVNGDVWPCCWLGSGFPMTSDTDNGWQLKRLPLVVNALNNTLDEVLDSWNHISDTWNSDEPLSTCIKTCGKCKDYTGARPVGLYITQDGRQTITS